MKLFIFSILITLFTAYSWAYGDLPSNNPDEAALNNRLDSLDARIDQERNENLIQPWQADELHNEVQTIRAQEYRSPSQEVLNQEADNVEEQLFPPH